MTFYIKHNRFLSSKLQKAWIKMQTNKTVTPYLYYNYMRCVFWETKLLSLWSPRIYYAEDDKGIIRMIAPMRLHLFNGVIDSLGNLRMCDVTDFLFDEITDDEKKQIICEFCKSIGHDFYLSRFLSDSETLQFFNTKVQNKTEVDCVKIKIVDSYEDYFKKLSSSVRQNVRTAYNRINRDNHSMEFKFFVGAKNIPDIVKREAEDCYINRQVSNYSQNWLMAMKKKIGIRYFRHEHYSLHYSDNAVMALLYIDGVVAGMFAGIMSNAKDTVVIPRLAINMDYHFYSPGYILLIETIKYCYDNNNVRIIDLCRGTEKYKLDLGGDIYKTVKVEIKN